jgi:peptidyl-prolyl cis-trans isomerase D
MLKVMRRYASGWLVKALFGIIIIVFVLYFGSSTLGRGDKVLTTVGSHKVTVTEYQETYKRLLNLYRNLYRDKFDEDMVKRLKLNETAMNQIVDRYLLLGKAKDLGLTVTDVEFADYLGSMEAFKREGKFDGKLYAEALKRNNIDARQFEESQKAELLAEKLIAIVRDNGVFLTDNDIWQAYVKEKGKVNLSFALYEPAQFRTSVNVNEQDLNSLYDKEKDKHFTEPTYTLRYIVFDEKSPVKDDVAYTDLLKAKDFEAYAKQKGLEILDLGTVKQSEALGKLKDLKGETWLKDLKKGDISLPARGPTKSYIFQVLNKQEGQPLEKTAVLKEIRERVVEEKSKVLAREKAIDAINQKNADFKQETGYFPRSVPTIPKIGQLPLEDAAVLSLSEQNRLYGKPVEIMGKYYVFSYKGEELPDKGQWEKEKDAYGRFLLARQQDEQIKSFIDNLRKRANVKIDWKDL